MAEPAGKVDTGIRNMLVQELHLVTKEAILIMVAILLTIPDHCPIFLLPSRPQRRERWNFNKN